MIVERLSYLFADVEGSSRLWEEHPTEMGTALAAHDEIINREVKAAGGTVVKGTGDGFMAVFADAADAVRASIAIQMAHAGTDFQTIEGISVRIGIHAGESQPRAGDFYGPEVNRAARLMGIGHGGQILVSAAVRSIAGDALGSPTGLRSLGEHRLKDLAAPEQVFQVIHPDLRGRRVSGWPLQLRWAWRRHRGRMARR